MIEALACPLCGGPMTSRQNGATGQRFWGCNAYPTCRGTRDTDGEPSGRSVTPRGRDQVVPQHQVDDDAGLPSDRMRRNDRSRWR